MRTEWRLASLARRTTASLILPVRSLTSRCGPGCLHRPWAAPVPARSGRPPGARWWPSRKPSHAPAHPAAGQPAPRRTPLPRRERSHHGRWHRRRTRGDPGRQRTPPLPRRAASGPGPASRPWGTARSARRFKAASAWPGEMPSAEEAVALRNGRPNSMICGRESREPAPATTFSEPLANCRRGSPTATRPQQAGPRAVRTGGDTRVRGLPGLARRTYRRAAAGDRPDRLARRLSACGPATRHAAAGQALNVTWPVTGRRGRRVTPARGPARWSGDAP